MDKRLREISRFFVAPPRVFPLSVCARARESTQIFIQKYLQLSSEIWNQKWLLCLVFNDKYCKEIAFLCEGLQTAQLDKKVV